MEYNIYSSFMDVTSKKINPRTRLIYLILVKNVGRYKGFGIKINIGWEGG